MDDLVFHEKLRYNILLWDDLTAGKLGSNSWEKKSGRATFSTLIPSQGVTFMLVSHVSLLLDYPICISTFICIPEHFFYF